MYRRWGKRFFDVIVAAVALILLSPLFILIALLIRLDSRGSILFIQERLGRGGKIFRAYKFRTMTDRPRVSDHEIIGRDPEITRVGYWLRRFKLDELPQLINVIKGDMSIVGPRPALPSQLSVYDSKTMKRLVVRPGLTGLAQVNGNIHLSWPERWQYDIWYVEHLSLMLDLKIIIKTFAVIIFGEDKFYKQPSLFQNSKK